MGDTLRRLHVLAWSTYALPTFFDLPEIRIMVVSSRKYAVALEGSRSISHTLALTS